jgi:hypothetical protein
MPGLPNGYNAVVRCMLSPVRINSAMVLNQATYEVLLWSNQNREDVQYLRKLRALSLFDDAPNAANFANLTGHIGAHILDPQITPADAFT